MKYTVEVYGSFTKIVEVEGSNAEEAMAKARDLIKKSDKTLKVEAESCIGGK